MKRMVCANKFKYGLILLIILIILFIPITITFLSFDVAAGQETYKYNKIEKIIPIQKNNYHTIEFDFQSGKEIEIIVKFQVIQDLPVDIWFVNDDNYLLLTNGAQFLFFMDGSDQYQTFGRKIVTFTEYDKYLLVFTNYYANDTVEIDLIYEIRTYDDQNNDDKSGIILYTLMIVIIILTIIIAVLLMKIRRKKKHDDKKADKKVIKNIKKEKTKQIIKKSDKKRKWVNTKTNKKTPLKKSIKDTKYCGHCGKSVTTPFCSNCGSEISKYD